MTTQPAETAHRRRREERTKQNIREWTMSERKKKKTRKTTDEQTESESICHSVWIRLVVKLRTLF